MDRTKDTRAQARRALISDANETRDDRDRGRQLWQGLVDGRWSFRDAFEVGDQRYLVAVRADVVDTCLVLTWTERRVAALIARGFSVKFTALELGLSDSRVSQSLAFALKKLGLRTRSELITTCCEIAPAHDEAPPTLEPELDDTLDTRAPPPARTQRAGTGGRR